jgi:hypothetical protein
VLSLELSLVVPFGSKMVILEAKTQELEFKRIATDSECSQKARAICERNEK